MPKASNWTVNTLAQLQKIAGLPNNWDGYGSIPPEPLLIDMAELLLARLENIIPTSTPVPFVCPISGGGFQFEWSSVSKHLELTFYDDTTIIFLQEDTQNQTSTTKSGEVRIEDVNKIRQLLDWFVK